MLRTDKIQFSCKVSDRNTEIGNLSNFKEIDLQKKKV
jgi:hypothetical protein